MKLLSEIPASEAQSILAKRANHHRLNPTKAELATMALLDSEGIPYRFQSVHFGKGVFRIFDFYLTKHKVVLEVDGECHEVETDARKDGFMKSRLPKWTVVRFSNHEVMNSPEIVRDRIRASLSGWAA